MSSCPWGHGAGSSACAIERVTSKVAPHARHLTSYLGTLDPPLLATVLTPTGGPVDTSVTPSAGTGAHAPLVGRVPAGSDGTGPTSQAAVEGQRRAAVSG